MTATDLPTDRLRQLRDGHDPDGAHAGAARRQRIADTQREIIEADELVAGLRRYRAAARRLDADPHIIRYVDRVLVAVEQRKAAERQALDNVLRQIQ